MPSSLVKFTNRKVHAPSGKKLFWGRVHEDGLPFRGMAPPVYTQEEMEERLVRVGDPQADTFDLTNPEQKARYLEVLDGIVNGHYQCLYVDRMRSRKNPRKVFVHVEWVEYFMEDGTPTSFMSPSMMELYGGQTNFPGHPG